MIICFYLLLLAMGMMLDHPVCMERNGSVKKSIQTGC